MPDDREQRPGLVRETQSVFWLLNFGCELHSLPLKLVFRRPGTIGTRAYHPLVVAFGSCMPLLCAPLWARPEHGPQRLLVQGLLASPSVILGLYALHRLAAAAAAARGRGQHSRYIGMSWFEPALRPVAAKLLAEPAALVLTGLPSRPSSWPSRQPWC